MRTFLFALTLLHAVAAQALTIQVSPKGPVSSLAAARDLIRKARAEGAREAVSVEIEDGVYPLTEPVQFGPRDGGTKESPVTYAAARGAKPLFSGARKITGFKAGPDGVWSAQVDPGWNFEALWVNGARATRARTPNEGYVIAKGAPETPKGGAVFSPMDVAELAALSSAELGAVNAVVFHKWETSRHRLTSVDAASGVVKFTGPAPWAFGSNRAYFENYKAALDAPGEWFLNSEGTLSYRPHAGEKIEDAEVYAPVATQWITVAGEASQQKFVEHLHFKGLRFAFQNWTLPEKGWSSAQADPELPGAIELKVVRNVTFEDCDFAHTLTHAVRFLAGCHDSTLAYSYFHDLGAGGVYIGETAASKDAARATDHITVENCIIQNGGRHFAGAVGIWVGQSGDNLLSHCDIGDFFYTAISLGWTWGYKENPSKNNRVEFCHLHHLGLGVLSDLGGVYTLGPSPGTVIRGCRIHDISCANYGGWGMYNDEGSSGVLWENNLVYRAESGSYHLHFGRENVISNNILAFAGEVQLRRTKKEDHLSATFQRNIILFSENPVFGPGDANWQDASVVLDHNLYWRTDGGDFAFAGKNFADWQATGHDTGSLVADPHFADAKNDNFKLVPDSPALQLGFQPFDASLAGVTKDEKWKALAVKAEMPPVKFSKKWLKK